MWLRLRPHVAAGCGPLEAPLKRNGEGGERGRAHKRPNGRRKWALPIPLGREAGRDGLAVVESRDDVEVPPTRAPTPQEQGVVTPHAVEQRQHAEADAMGRPMSSCVLTAVSSQWACAIAGAAGYAGWKRN